MTSRQGPSHTASTSGVRRNLFHHSLNRRVVAPNAASSSATTSLHAASGQDSSSDIVARDEHGNYQLDQPSLAPLPRDELQEEREVDNRLIETYGKQHRQHIEPNEELKASLQASLLAKVESLEEDKWMFEPDDQKPS